MTDLDLMLKLPADALETPRRLKPQIRNWLKARAIGEFMLKGDELVTASHHIAIKVHENLITKFATYDGDGNELTPPTFAGPHLMVRILDHEGSRRARNAWNAAMDNLPAGVSIVPNPGTVAWA